MPLPFQRLEWYNTTYFLIGGIAVRIVVKIGTSTLAYATGQLNIRRVEAAATDGHG